MDTVALVENQIDDGQKLLDLLSDEGMVVKAACWIKPFDLDRWSLWIATPTVDEKGKLEAYKQILNALKFLGDDWLTGSDITVVGEKNPLVPFARDILRRFPHKTPIPSPRQLDGGMSPEEVFVYPPEKVNVTIYGLVFRGDPMGSLHLSLEPPNPNSKMTIGTQVYPAETGIDWVVAAPKGAKLERKENGMMALTWDRHGTRMLSSANEVWSLANLRLHGFRFLREPS